MTPDRLSVESMLGAVAELPSGGLENARTLALEDVGRLAFRVLRPLIAKLEVPRPKLLADARSGTVEVDWVLTEWEFGLTFDVARRVVSVVAGHLRSDAETTKTFDLSTADGPRALAEFMTMFLRPQPEPRVR